MRFKRSHTPTTISAAIRTMIVHSSIVLYNASNIKGERGRGEEGGGSRRRRRGGGGGGARGEMGVETGVAHSGRYVSGWGGLSLRALRNYPIFCAQRYSRYTYHIQATGLIVRISFRSFSGIMVLWIHRTRPGSQAREETAL